MPPIDYCVTVDTEEEWDWNSGYPTARPSVENIQKLPAFQDLLDEYGAAATYFANYAVLADPRSAEVLLRLSRRPSVELGLHIHPWNTPPLAEASTVPNRDTYLHQLPWSEAREKLTTVRQAFLQLGLSPTSFRGGRYSTSPAIQNELRDHGIWVDCSTLPYKRWPDPEAPNFRGATLQPRRQPPRRPGDRPLWELPLSTGYTRRPFVFWNSVDAAAQSRLGRLVRASGVLDRLGIVSPDWLNLEQPRRWPITRFLETLERMSPPFICLTVHSSSLLPGGSPYSKTAGDVERILQVARAALHWLRENPRFRATTATDAARHLEETFAGTEPATTSQPHQGL